MAGAAVLSTGPTTDLDSCREDVLNFLQLLHWRIRAIEVKVWTSTGLSSGRREWNVEGSEIETMAGMVAQFIADLGVGTRGIVLVREAVGPPRLRARFQPLRL